jgi:hypothetical protein
LVRVTLINRAARTCPNKSFTGLAHLTVFCEAFFEVKKQFGDFSWPANLGPHRFDCAENEVAQYLVAPFEIGDACVTLAPGFFKREAVLQRCGCALLPSHLNFPFELAYPHKRDLEVAALAE